MKKQVNIYIGEYYASRVPVIIYTYLGSCVAVCLFDKKNRIGGMNHILLPGKPDLNRFDPSARYGINAMELLINKIMNLGGDRSKIVAKIFGGAHIIPYISPLYSAGTRISEFVKIFLNKEKIKIISSDIEGCDIREVYFHTDTGVVYVKHISCKNYKSILKKEKESSKRIKKESLKPGRIEIFPKPD